MEKGCLNTCECSKCSLHKILDKATSEKLQNAISKYNLKPQSLSIEILERLFIDKFYYIKEILINIKGLGVTIALDDFDTGYSSLSYLSQLPIDTLKIDISLIRKIETDAVSYQLIKAMVKIAKELRLKTIAECVETDNQYMLLKELDINCIQGYLFYEPLPRDAFENLFI